MKLLRKVFNYFSVMSVFKAVNEEPRMRQMWDLSKTVLQNLTDHYATLQIDTEGQGRLRLLLCAQAVFMRKVVESLSKKGNTVNGWVDVGDSDGAARLLFLKSSPQMGGFRTLGVNLEPEAVALIRSKGLEAQCLNAMDLHKTGVTFDLVSIFETLEHMPNPLGFLESIQPVVGRRLIVSVPLIVSSRVALGYLSPKWSVPNQPTYSNNHFFELCPSDWKKLFSHAGWTIEDEWKVCQFPRSGPLNWLMTYAWRKMSFEGYWFVSLKKDDTFTSRFIR